MKTTKILISLCFAFFLACTNINAQVTIGTQTAPHKGAVLDLDVTDKGLLLPKVSLNDVSVFTLQTDTKSSIGMVVYNTNASIKGGNGVGLYMWDGTKWHLQSSSGAAMTINPDPLPSFTKDGGNATITVTSPAAAGVSGHYTYVVVSGGEYGTVNPQNSENGQFTITVDPNATAAERKVIVMVTDPAGNQTTLVFNQTGDSSTCQGTRNPSITTTGTTLCVGGAVYMSISNPESGVNYVWMLGSNKAGEGNYLIATQAGTYTVYAGSAGCTYKASQTITGSSTTAPSATTTVVSENGGILCGSSGSVKLTALGNPTGVIWFQNGVKRADKTGAIITLNGGSADAGDWVAVVNNGSCYSKPSNIVPVVYNSTGSGKITLNAADVLVNGNPISSITGFCPGGSLVLSVNNPQTGVTYKWYDGATEISSPYTIPTSQTSMLLRLVATDNSGSLCPAEANSAEKTITGSTPAAPTIDGANGVCSGQTTRLAVTVTGATSYEWFKNGESQGATANNYIDASAGSYSVRYATASGCISTLSAVKTVAAQGAPQIDWNEFITEANQTNTYTFSVRSTGTTAPTAYSWSAAPAANATITGSGTNVSIKFNGAAVISVTPSNSCGSGSAISKSVNILTTTLSAVALTPTSGTYCNSVSFKLAKPADWTAAEWAGLTTSNITATLGGSAYSGSLTNDGTYYYYSIAATGTNQTATITVAGSIGSKPVTSTTASVTVSISTESSFSVAGTSCFDIAYQNDGGSCGNLAQRKTSGKADLTKTYTYGLAGTLGSGVTITSVVWSYTNANGVITNFTPSASSTTMGNNNTAVKFDEALSTTALGQTGVEVVITATITTNSFSCGKAVYTVSQKVKIRDCQCCPGYLSQGGEYVPGNTSQYLGFTGGTSFATLTNPSGAWRFAKTGKDLCFYKTDASNGSSVQWTAAVTNCNNGSWADGNSESGWRLPNSAELGSINDDVRAGTSGAVGQGIAAKATASTDTKNLVWNSYSGYYWSSTEHNSTSAGLWSYGSNTNGTSWSGKTGNTYPARCVRPVQ